MWVCFKNDYSKNYSLIPTRHQSRLMLVATIIDLRINIVKRHCQLLDLIDSVERDTVRRYAFEAQADSREGECIAQAKGEEAHLLPLSLFFQIMPLDWFSQSVSFSHQKVEFFKLYLTSLVSKILDWSVDRCLPSKFLLPQKKSLSRLRTSPSTISIHLQSSLPNILQVRRH